MTPVRIGGLPMLTRTRMEFTHYIVSYFFKYLNYMIKFVNFTGYFAVITRLRWWSNIGYVQRTTQLMMVYANRFWISPNPSWISGPLEHAGDMKGLPLLLGTK